MPAPRSSSGSSRASGRAKSTPSAAQSSQAQSKSSARSARKPSPRKPSPRKPSPRKPSQARKPAQPRKTSQAGQTSRPAARTTRAGVADGISNLVEQLANRVIKPMGLVVLTRERIQETLDEAAERGRVTRADANELVAELVRRGRQQTDDLLGDVERLLGRGRGQLESATRQSMDRIARGADRAKRTMGVGPSFPISGYDDLTAGQVEQRLDGLKPAELRKVRDYECRHANRKSVLEAIERALG